MTSENRRDTIVAKWDGMTPRERDAWIAEVVFGNVIEKERRLDGNTWMIVKDGFTTYRTLVPNYTTDISAAWAVASEFDRSEIGKYEGKWTAALGVPGWYATAVTAPEAIGLAAILAKLLT